MYLAVSLLMSVMSRLFAAISWVVSRHAPESMKAEADGFAGEITSVEEEEMCTKIIVKWLQTGKTGGPYLVPNRWAVQGLSDFHLTMADMAIVRRPHNTQC